MMRFPHKSATSTALLPWGGHLPTSASPSSSWLTVLPPYQWLSACLLSFMSTLHVLTQFFSWPFPRCVPPWTHLPVPLSCPLPRFICASASPYFWPLFATFLVCSGSCPLVCFD
ncbi:hypothetical protein U0070_019798 [Myodes glareolus]|uniref:Uncharacterized protein n=1 Tax=Myodes glareolus TaxID=447135 RepID=A0AAW0JC27_MYOGA